MENFIFCAVYPFGKSKSKTMVESLRFYKIFLRMWLCSKWTAIPKTVNFLQKSTYVNKKEQGTYSAIRKIPIFRITSRCEIFVERRSFLPSFGQFVRSALGLQFY